MIVGVVSLIALSVLYILARAVRKKVVKSILDVKELNDRKLAIALEIYVNKSSHIRSLITS